MMRMQFNFAKTNHTGKIKQHEGYYGVNTMATKNQMAQIIWIMETTNYHFKG